ncbi:uncharacterized protein LOC107776907 isoform X1 [Nicotiana tabacum]|uniref:RPM1-interacting protein 4-like isoform X1 n=2 Tax=Nicotiana TaxID=4085 RepID=A0A1S3YJR6_TOBAC|nr:PREDICTED: RPM1-interacting protein 4-like isoform X1 [Nicotiana tabacum]
MAKQREKNGSTSVPQFGAWGHKTGDNLNFSMVFSQARANKKQNRHNLAQHNLGNEQEILAKLQEVSPRKDSSTPVPQFGAGNQKTEGNPDYSKVSPKAHANKKPHRHDLTRRSLENEKELGKHQEKRPMSVPQFGVWDQKSGGSPDYAKVSPQARTEKKQHKHASARRKLGNEQELRKHNEASPRKNSPVAMPQHGAQDQKTGDNPNYPMVFSQAHAKKKQHKPHSLGNEQELGKRQDVSPMKTGWLSVPQFGEWDQKTPSETNYSVVFSQARANRKHHKSDLTYRSYDFEQDLLCREREQAARRKKNKFLTYLSCCLPV